MRAQGLRIHVHNLGCRLNQFESDSLEARFLAEGWVPADSPGSADLVVVNTCTITGKADRKTRNTIRHLQSLRPEGSPLVLTGCHVENHPGADWGPGVLQVDNARKNRLYEETMAWLDGTSGELPPPDPFGYRESGSTRRARAWLKIQDGCDRFCTYCIVPHVRGRAVSRPEKDILCNLRDLESQGFAEAVLTGVNMGTWKEGSRDFCDLTEALLAGTGTIRLRLASLEPDLPAERFARLFAHPRLMPHAHLCLQSGSDRILALMGRPGTARDYCTLVAALRRVRPDAAVSTDLICGFPGETDEEFRESLALCRDLGMSAIHVFPYARRQGTRADTLPEQIDRPETLRRAREARQVAERLETDHLSTRLGIPSSLVVETEETSGDDLILGGHLPGNEAVRLTLPGRAREKGQHRRRVIACVPRAIFRWDPETLVLDAFLPDETMET